uniref:PUM-HD domain-containing protein n=1 Tax=Caenorhabditis japonica TaxID=281687 RepID=A0A8R1HR76_CAEJA
MSRPISIANAYNSEPLASPIESLGRSFGAQQIVDSVCGSPIQRSFANRHVSINQKNDFSQDTPDFHFNSFYNQGGKVLGQNTAYMFGTPPSSTGKPLPLSSTYMFGTPPQTALPLPSAPCTCSHHTSGSSIINNQLAAALLSVNNNFMNSSNWNEAALFAQHQMLQQQSLTPSLESQLIAARNMHAASFSDANLMNQVQPSSLRVPVQTSSTGVFPTNTFRDTTINDDLLTRYRANPSMMKGLKLSDIRGMLLKFAKDQVGSRFIQQKLEFCDKSEKDSIFDEVLENAHELVDDIFGNYVVQKFFEYGEEKHWSRLVDAIIERVPTYAFQMYACRVLQKALEKVSEPLQIKILIQIRQVIPRCMKDQNGNHVIQKAIEKVDSQYIQFIVDALLETPNTIYEMSVDPYGCRVVQRCLEHCIPSQTTPMIERIHERFDEIANNQYGNYVVQHVIQHGSEKDRIIIVERVSENLLEFATHKYSSNVIEKCLELGAVYHKGIIVRSACHHPDGSVPIVVQMMKDQYANYVVQKMFDQVTMEQRRELILAVRPHIPILREYPHGKHILAKLDKYFQKQVLTNYQYPVMPGSN